MPGTRRGSALRSGTSSIGWPRARSHRYSRGFGLVAARSAPDPRRDALPGYAAALAALGDAELTALLARRPDLLAGGGPATFPELASRAGTPASLAAALRGLDLGALRLAELLAVVGFPTTRAELAAAAGPGLAPGRLDAALAALAALGIALPGRDGRIAGPLGLAAPFGRPGGLGPTVAELAKVGLTRDQLARIAAHLGAVPFSPPGPSADRAPAGPGPSGDPAPARPGPSADREPAGSPVAGPGPRWGEGSGPPGSGEAGPPAKGALVRAVAAALRDPDMVAKALADADEAAHRLLDQALTAPGPLTVLGVGYGRFAGYPDAEPATWLVERGLLLPVSYNQFVVPREAALGLRGGLVFPLWPEPPGLDRPAPAPAAADRAAAAAARAVVAAEGLCTRLDRAPLELVRAGTISVRDLRRLAGELGLPDDEVALLLDLLVEAAVLAVGGPFDRRSLGLRPEADAWLAAARAVRWADLAATWRDSDLAVEDHLAARHRADPEGVDRPRPLAGRRLGAAGVRRRGLLAALDAVPPASSVDLDGLASLLAWRQPLAWPGPSAQHRPARSPPLPPESWTGPAGGPTGSPGSATAPARPDGVPPGTRVPPPALARAVADAAAFLGVVVVADGRVAPGLPAAGLGRDALASVAAGVLPEGSDRFLVAGDLTVVAPGGLAPAVEATLAGMAERERASGPTAWRVTEASLRRAFDEGVTPDQLLAFFRGHSDTPLPQALEYLVADGARRHGRLRVGGATSYLRGEPALVAAAVRSAAGRRLGLRELAPGVAVSDRPQADLLAALRKAGEAPLGEEPDGRPRLEARRPVRHTARPAADSRAARAADRAGTAADPAAVVARLRGSR